MTPEKAIEYTMCLITKASTGHHHELSLLWPLLSKDDDFDHIIFFPSFSQKRVLLLKNISYLRSASWHCLSMLWPLLSKDDDFDPIVSFLLFTTKKHLRAISKVNTYQQYHQRGLKLLRDCPGLKTIKGLPVYNFTLYMILSDHLGLSGSKLQDSVKVGNITSYGEISL